MTKPIATHRGQRIHGDAWKTTIQHPQNVDRILLLGLGANIRGGRAVLVDLGSSTGRQVNFVVTHVDGVFLYDVDDLEGVLAHHLARPS